MQHENTTMKQTEAIRQSELEKTKRQLNEDK
jgi:hypothetical protein